MAVPRGVTRGFLFFLLVVSVETLFGVPVALAAATKLVVILPGQTFVPGVGAVGAPDPIELRTPHTVEIYAVDQFGNVVFDYGGRVVIPVVPVGTGTIGPPMARRVGTSISGAGAAPSIPAGQLRLSLGGGPFQEISVAPASGPAAVCQAIEAAVHAVPASAFDYGDFEFWCRATSTPVPGSLRFTLFLDDGTPVRAVMQARASGSGGSAITIDPTFGLAPLLRFGAPNPSSNPSSPDDYAMRTLIPSPIADQRFSRGLAVFEVALTDMALVGTGRTMSVDQGTGPALPVESGTFDVTPPACALVSGTAIGDGNGRINRARIVFSRKLDASTIGAASDFTLEVPGFPPIPGTSLSVVPTTEHGYDADQIEVTFGTGLGRTDITNVEVRYTPPSSNALTCDNGLPAPAFSVSPGTTPRLVDGAPPVLVSAFAQDLDSNNGHDRMVFFFSEPVGFSAARALSLGGLFDPSTDPAAMTMPVPFDLRIRATELATFEDVVQVVDPNNAAATAIQGADAIAAAITSAVVGARPAYRNFTCTFTSGRYVLRAGVPVAFSRIEVLSSGTPGDGAPTLKLGVSNGGVERAGSGDALAAMPAELVVRGQSGANLLLGKTEADLVVSGNTITVQLTNVPGSGTAQPGFLWRDDGDLGFLSDRSSVRLRLTPRDSYGNGDLAHPSRLLREAASIEAPDGSLSRTGTVGSITLDGSPSLVPLNAQGPETPAVFRWVQVGGPFVPIPAHNNGVVTVVPTVPGVYVFELQVIDATNVTTHPYNPYLDADGSLERRLTLSVQPGPAEHSVVVLPGQELMPGTDSATEVLGGTPLVQTEGTPFTVQVFLTDAFFNVVTGPPGASVRLTTSDPDDVEPAAKPFVQGAATFTLTSSHAATAMIPEVDDEVPVALEHGDIHWPYVVGSLWNASPLPKLPGAPSLARFAWVPDPRATRWNIYRSSLHAIGDVDRDGLPDLGYGACAPDPNPGDSYFEDAAMPPPGDGYMYAGRESLLASGMIQTAGLGLTGGGHARPSPPPCP